MGQQVFSIMWFTARHPSWHYFISGGFHMFVGYSAIKLLMADSDAKDVFRRS